MPLLRSKKVSFTILAALITVNWFVSLHAVDNDASNSTAPTPLNAMSAQLPTLESIQSWSTLGTDQVSSRFKRFSAPILIASLPGIYSSSLQTEPLPELIDAPVSTQAESVRPAASLNADSNPVMTSVHTADERPTRGSASNGTKRAPRSEDLVKLLAAFYLLNR
jgi:hypothetical protein